MSAKSAKKPARPAKAIFELKNGKPTTLDCYEILVNPKLQVREGGTSPSYVEELKEKLKNGATLPRVKVIRVDDGGIKGDFIFDGHHTLEATKQSGAKTVRVTLYTGTWADALQAAAQANREHDDAGKRMTRDDKRKALKLFFESIEFTPVSRRPSERQIAALLGVSHTFVSLNAPGKPPKAEEQAAPPAAPAAKAAAQEEEEEEEEAPAKPAPATPAAKLFDWAALSGSIGSVKRGLEGMVDIYGLKDTPEHVACKNALETFLQHFETWREKHGK